MTTTAETIHDKAEEAAFDALYERGGSDSTQGSGAVARAVIAAVADDIRADERERVQVRADRALASLQRKHDHVLALLNDTERALIRYRQGRTIPQRLIETATNAVRASGGDRGICSECEREDCATSESCEAAALPRDRT